MHEDATAGASAGSCGVQTSALDPEPSRAVVLGPALLIEERIDGYLLLSAEARGLAAQSRRRHDEFLRLERKYLARAWTLMRTQINGG